MPMQSVVKPASTLVTSAALITVLEDKQVKICYLDKFDAKQKNQDGSPVIARVVNFSDGTKCKVFKFEELPVLFPDDVEVGAEIIYRVKSDDGKIVEFLPENEDGLDGRVVSFYRTNGENTPPIPAPAKKWREDSPDVLQFCAKFKLEGGSFDGKFVDGYFQFEKSGISKKGNPYTFTTFPKDENGNVGIGWEVLPNGSTDMGDWADKVWGLLKHGGVTEGNAIPMPEDNNPLLQIEQKLLQANRHLKLDVHNGYVSAISSPKKLTVTINKPAEPVQAVETPKVEVGQFANENIDEM
jgi:hypothetical protein